MLFPISPGIIALDIDGTITDQIHTIPLQVVQYFQNLYNQHWQFIFITGRSFQWGFRTLEPLPFRYSFAFQNGALMLDMPSRNVLGRKDLNFNILPSMDVACHSQHSDFVIYSGWENQDICYYRPHYWPKEMLSYILQRAEKLEEHWVAVDRFDTLPINHFLSVKCFASTEQEAFKLSECIERETKMHVPINRDPFNPSWFVIQATHPDANKGYALQSFIQLYPSHGPVIAAGDDYNDLSMLEQADIKVVMANAPDELKKIADILAPSANQNGIIEGLNQALQIARKRK